MQIGLGIGLNRVSGGGVSLPNNAPDFTTSYAAPVQPGSAPLFVSMTPAVGSANQVINADPVLAFSMPVNAGPVSAKVYVTNRTDSTLIKAYDVVTDYGTAAGQLEIVNGQLVIHRSANWTAGKRIEVTWDAAALVSPGGIPIAVNSGTAVYFDVAGSVTQPSVIGMAAGAYGLTNLVDATKSVIYAADVEVPDTGTKYLMAEGTIATRFTIESGRVRFQMRDSVGTVLFNAISSAVNLVFPSANTRKRLVALAYDDGALVRYQVWADGSSIISGTAARTANNWDQPTWWNATSGGGANSASLTMRGLWIGQAAALPATMPTYSTFFDTNGLWVVPFTGDSGGFTPTFAEGGSAATWTARSDTTGTFTGTSTIPADFTAGMWTVTANGATGTVVVDASSLPSDGGATATGINVYEDAALVATISAATGPQSVTGRTNDVLHSYYIKLVNANGPAAGGDIKTAEPYIAAPITVVDATGWQATYPTPPGSFSPNTAPEKVLVSRAGYTQSAGTTTYSDRMIVSTRVRQAYPNNASLTASTVALADYVYSTDSIAGVTNNSAEASPLPVANWVMNDRVVVGNTLSLELMAFHRDARNGQPVAAVEFRATDGTNTVTQVVGGCEISPRSTDRAAVIVYRSNLDITSLTAGQITANAKVYPWIGNASSVLDSASSSVAREFSPRTFTKDTTKFASPPYAYVSSTGNDGTGVVSTNATTAAATPFLTIKEALKAFKTQSGVTGGIMDGCILRVGSGTFVMASTTVAGDVAQTAACVTITRDPNVSRANAVVTFGAAAFRTRFPYLRFNDVTITRTGTLTLQGESAAQMSIYMDDVTFNNASNNAAILNQSHVYWNGATITGLSASLFNAGTYEIRMIRGVSGATPGTTVEGWLVAGSSISGMSNILAGGSRSQNKSIIAFNLFPSMTTANTNGILNAGGSESLTGIVVAQNVVEILSSTTSSAGLRISADGNIGNITHAIIWHNIITGAEAAGRSNLLYDDNTGSNRTHKLNSIRGNIHAQINYKSDVFKTDGTKTGTWSYEFGIGCYGEFTMYRDAGSGGALGFQQDWPGLWANIGTSNTTRNDPLFTTYAGPAIGVNGAGGGVYTLQSGSPAKNILKNACLPFDIAGTARPITGTSAGAYQ